MQQWRWFAGSLLSVALLGFWLARMEPDTNWWRWTLSFLLPLLLSGYGLKKRSLDTSGAGLAVLVGFILTAASACFSASLIIFFFTSSRLTKWKAAEKRKLEEEYKEGGQRNWVQVLCNGGVASGCGLLYLGVVGMKEVPLRQYLGGSDFSTLLSIAVLASLSCSCGDTWASEVGSVIGGKPHLITSFRSVPTGTNGGITLVGVVSSLAGGAVVGLTHYLTLLILWNDDWYTGVNRVEQLELVVLGAVSGLLGSLIDSILGATLQYSGYSDKLKRVVNSPGPGVKHVAGKDILDNHTVNFLSSLVTALLVPLFWTTLHTKH